MKYKKIYLGFIFFIFFLTLPLFTLTNKVKAATFKQNDVYFVKDQKNFNLEIDLRNELENNKNRFVKVAYFLKDFSIRNFSNYNEDYFKYLENLYNNYDLNLENLVINYTFDNLDVDFKFIDGELIVFNKELYIIVNIDLEQIKNQNDYIYYFNITNKSYLYNNEKLDRLKKIYQGLILNNYYKHSKFTKEFIDKTNYDFIYNLNITELTNYIIDRMKNDKDIFSILDIFVEFYRQNNINYYEINNLINEIKSEGYLSNQNFNKLIEIFKNDFKNNFVSNDYFLKNLETLYNVFYILIQNQNSNNQLDIYIDENFYTEYGYTKENIVNNKENLINFLDLISETEILFKLKGNENEIIKNKDNIILEKENLIISLNNDLSNKNNKINLLNNKVQELDNTKNELSTTKQELETARNEIIKLKANLSASVNTETSEPKNTIENNKEQEQPDNKEKKEKLENQIMFYLPYVLFGLVGLIGLLLIFKIIFALLRKPRRRY